MEHRSTRIGFMNRFASPSFALALFAIAFAGCEDGVKEETPRGPGIDLPSAVTSTREPTPAPTPIPPTPAPAPKAIGQPVIVSGTLSGKPVRFAITVNGVRDPVTSTNQFNRPMGRWVLVDWTIKNEGTENAQITTLDLKLLTVDSFEISRGNHTGLPEPDLEAFPTLGPGQSIRGYWAYDAPSGAVLGAAIYHPSGSPQIVIADLP